jgi:hypothetical protein
VYFIEIGVIPYPLLRIKSIYPIEYESRPVLVLSKECNIRTESILSPAGVKLTTSNN